MNLRPGAAADGRPPSSDDTEGADAVEPPLDAGRPAEQDTPVDEGPRPPKRRGLRALLPAPIWYVGRLLILALIVEYLLVPQLAGPRKVAHLITQVNPLLL